MSLVSHTMDKILGVSLRPVYLRLVMGALSLVTLSAIENLGISTALPLAERALGHLWLYGWLFSSFTLAGLVGGVLFGALSDRGRPSRALEFSMGLFTGGLLLGGLAPNMDVLVMGRALQGMGSGGATVISYIIINRFMSPVTRPKLLALFATAWVVPSFLAPPFAALIAQTLSWRWVFLGIVPGAILIATVSVIALRTVESTLPLSPEHTGRALLPRQVVRTVLLSICAAIGVTLLLLALTAGGVTRVAEAAIGLGAVAVSGAVLLRSVNVSNSHLYKRVVILRFVTSFSFFGVEPLLPLALFNVKHMSVTLAGLVITSSTISWTSASWIQSHWLQHKTLRWRLYLGLAIHGIGLVLLIYNYALPSSPGWITELAWFVSGGGMGLVFPTLTAAALSCSMASSEGGASSILQIFDAAGASLGVGLLGALVGSSAATQSGLGPPYLLGVTRLAPGLSIMCLAVAAAVGLVTTLKARPPIF